MAYNVRILLIFSALIGVIGSVTDEYGDNDDESLSTYKSIEYDDDCSDECTPKMEKARLIPGFIDPGTPGDLKVVYNGRTSVKCGNKIFIVTTTSSPKVSIDLEKYCSWATLIMFDPDLPLAPSYLHWLVANIPTSTLKKGFNKQAGTNVARYLPPATVTGYHRYTFCVYCQNATYSTKNRDGLLQRPNFNPRNFATEVRLGSPEACNFMYVVPVPDLLKIVDDKLDKIWGILG